MTLAGRARRWLWTAPAAVVLAGFAWAIAAAGKSHLPAADFTFNNNSEVSTLDPALVSSIPEGRILRALSEGLVIRDPQTLAILPGAAASWETTDEGRRWTFHLRPGMRWSNGNSLTVADFAFTFQRLLLPATASPYASFLFAVVGAKEYHAGSGPAGPANWSDVGIKTLDPLTLEFQLESPRPYFLHLVASTALLPVHMQSLQAMRQRYPDSWATQWLRPENLVCNGPYTLASRRINDRMRLVRNPRYWDADNVAFESIDALAVEHGGTALNMYLTGGCNWIDGNVPPLYVNQMLGREDFRPKAAPYLGLYFYRLNCTRPPLDDARVRKALAFTINREEVCKKLLQAGQEPCYTFVPWGKLGNYESPLAENASVALARRLLADAGYNKDRRLAPLSIHYNTAESHRDIAEVIARTWNRTLGIQVGMANQEWKVWLDSQTRLDYQISRSSWIADYPDASSFLGVFTSDNPNNRTGWKNQAFDELMARSESEADPEQRNLLLYKAERILQDEMPAIPIYSYVAQNVVNPRLGGFGNNPLNEQNPKFWYWKDDDELWQDRRKRVSSMQIVDAPGPAAGLYSKAARKARGS
ncbi:MAG: peptide ABC transporter substrate-binding protein [Planctomycetota bacterium]